jgi:transketolase C-terminal domain/subunit
VIGEGHDLAIIAMGNVAREAVAAVQILAAEGISCTMVVVASINPPPISDLAQLLSRFRLALTVEAHYRTGGVGSLVSEVIAERSLPCRLVRCGISNLPSGISGSQEYLYRVLGLSSDMLSVTALQALREVRGA